MNEMSVTDTTATTYPRWKKRERLAWTILLIATALWLFFVVSIPLSINWYLNNASVPQLAQVQGTRGVTLVGGEALSDLVAVEEGKEKVDLQEGTELRTDPDSQSSVLFFDRSTLTLFPHSTVTLNVMRQPRFGRSNQPARITITVHKGRVRAQIAPSTGRAVEWVVHSPQTLAPHGSIVLTPGSYAIESSNEMTHVSVRSGEATVTGQLGHEVRLSAGERAEVALGTSAVGPLPVKRNLLVNSDFTEPLNAAPISSGPLVEGWYVVSDQGGDGISVDGTVEIVTIGSNRALHFERTGSNRNHGETAVVQDVALLVGDYLSLVLRFDVELAYQSLSGGGEQSSEFPLIVRVDYKDVNGNLQHWTQGFYYQNEAGYHIQNGEQIPQNVPFSFERNLQEVLVDPQSIERIQFYASGWDWDVYVSQVELTAE